MNINVTNIKQYFLVIKIFDLDALLVIMNERLKGTTLKLNGKAIKRKIGKYPNQYLQLKQRRQPFVFYDVIAITYVFETIH